MQQTLIDSHCHLDRLDLERLGGTLDDVLAGAREQGVTQMLCVSITLEEFPGVLELAHRYSNVFASVGVHPNEPDCHEPEVTELVRLADDPKIIAIGETGLDYFRSEGSLDWQRQRFRHHIRAARECGKPLIIHTREAEEDTLAIMRDEGAEHCGGVMHCFTGSQALAEAALELDFYISFSGIVTFNNADALRAVARSIPAERLFVETDSPYLTPVPLRGKPNQPGNTRLVAECLAELRGCSVDEIARQTSENFRRLFALTDAYC
jgi:TatD DNase family protein